MLDLVHTTRRLHRHALVSGFALALVGLIATAPAAAGPIEPREGWVIDTTPHSFDELVERLEASVQEQNMGLVTAASASVGAANQGFTIPGNRVVGVYRNDFARRMLEASIAAGIEAPIRFYVTENEDGTATLSYRTPTTMFSPYFDEGGEALETMAGELDEIFAAIHAGAIAQ